MAILLSVALLLFGCASVDEAKPDRHLLDFLKDGQTNREEIASRLGPPWRTMESERILFYRLSQTPWGYFIAEPPREQWAGVTQSLVLVLDESGVLKKHSIVNVRKVSPPTQTP